MQTKESKKPKLEKNASSKSKPTKKAQLKQESSPSESSDSDSDGGVGLEDSEGVSAKEDHGLHPERAKAVVANSMSTVLSSI